MRNTELTKLVNTLAHLNAEIKALTAKADEIKAKIIDSGATEYATSDYKLAVYTVSKGTLDKSAVVEALGLAWVAAHTTVSTHHVVRVAPIVPVAAAA